MPNINCRKSQARTAPASDDHPLRAVLFVDYENAYKRAAELFFPGRSKGSGLREVGHFHPWKTGELICARYNKSQRRSSPPLELIETRVYWGHFLPNVKGGHRKSRAQEGRFDVWRNPPAKLGIRAANVNVRVIAPPRQMPAVWYPTERERRDPVEKEVDTAISVDLLTMAHANEFDVALLFSEDSDQRSVVIEVMDRFRSDDRTSGAPQIHLAGWGLSKRERKQWLALESDGAESTKKRLLRTKWDSILRVPDERLPDGCEMPQTHWVSSADYCAAADRRDYRVSQATWDTLVDRAEHETVVRVRGLDADTKGNRVYVEIEGMEATDLLGFVQRRELINSNDAEIEGYMGRSFDAVVHHMNPETGRVELSERQLVRQVARQELIDSVKEGAVFTGHVSGWDDTTGHVYVDLGHGVEGRIAKDEVFVGHRLTPSIVFGEGDEIQVLVLKHDRDRKQIALSATRLWSEAVAAMRDAPWTSGTIGKIRKDGTGLWVHLRGPVVGYVELNELSDRRISYVEQMGLEEGMPVPVVIIGNVEDSKVKLSLKRAREAAEVDGWTFDEYDRPKSP